MTEYINFTILVKMLNSAITIKRWEICNLFLIIKSGFITCTLCIFV